MNQQVRTIHPTKIRVITSETSDLMQIYVEYNLRPGDPNSPVASFNLEIGWRVAVDLMYAIREMVTIPQ